MVSALEDSKGQLGRPEYTNNYNNEMKDCRTGISRFSGGTENMTNFTF